MEPDVRRIAWILVVATAIIGTLAMASARFGGGGDDASTPVSTGPAEPVVPRTVSVDAPESDPLEAAEDAPEASSPATEDAVSDVSDERDEAADSRTPRHPPTPSAMATWRAKRDALPEPGGDWCQTLLERELTAYAGEMTPLPVSLAWDTRVRVALPEGARVTTEDAEASLRLALEERVRGGASFEIRLHQDTRVDELAATLGDRVERREVRVGNKIGTEICALSTDVIGRRIPRAVNGKRGPCSPMRATFVHRAVVVSSGDYLLSAGYKVPASAGEAHGKLSAVLDAYVVEHFSAPTID